MLNNRDRVCVIIAGSPIYLCHIISSEITFSILKAIMQCITDFTFNKTQSTTSSRVKTSCGQVDLNHVRNSQYTIIHTHSHRDTRTLARINAFKISEICDWMKLTALTDYLSFWVRNDVSSSSQIIHTDSEYWSIHSCFSLYS
uniref:Uncharacterized protein n=1 Tax=Trichobilharzia regenti TaxID=157069 RepID=A0AA85J8Z1_TRIRE|nr:unnamed protein product [Trichobilharzia regenti]